MHGGIDRAVVRGDTFTWDGNSRVRLTQANPPPARFRHALIEDGHGSLVMFGGGGNGDFSTPLNDTWTFDTLWRRAASVSFAGYAYDRDRRRIVRLGGSEPPITNYTHEMEDGRWVLRSASGPVVLSMGLVYDEARQQTVMFGGRAGGFFDATRTWDGTAWATVTATTRPSARAAVFMAYDATRAVTLLFGGVDAQNVVNDETWTWNGSEWQNLTSTLAIAPSARLGSAVAYDRVGEVVVLFGGLDGSQRLADTWTWNGAAWTRHDPPDGVTQPFAASYQVAVWNPIRKRVVLLTGDFGIDAWEWNGTSWEELPVPAAFGAASGAFPLPDGSGISVVTQAINGYAGGGYDLIWDNTQQRESCVAGEDRDGDSLSGCDDPDCWSTCTPSCPPDDPC
jgi:hypothetical protein